MSIPDKKWFVYAGVQQEGPLSLDEIRERITGHRLLGAHLAWCEGMPSWLKVEEIDALKAILHPPVPTPPPIPAGFGPPPLTAPQMAQTQPVAPAPTLHQPQPVLHQPQPVLHQPQPVLHQPAPTLHQPTLHQPTLHQPTLHPQPMQPYQPAPAFQQPAPPQSPPAPTLHAPAPPFHAQPLHPALGAAPLPQAPAPPAHHHSIPHDDEPETDLTPHGLLIEDDEPTTSSLSLTGHHQPMAIAEPETDQPEKEELSALIYMKVDGPEEKTSSIDVRTLKKAEKEAAKVSKIAEKSSRDFERKVVRHETRKGGRWMRGGVLLVLGGAIGTGLGYGYQWFTMNQHWFRTLPETAGVQAGERADLELAITTPLAESPRVGIAMAQNGTQAPSFFVASNLPDGARIDVYVHGEPETLVGQAKFDSVLQVKLNGGIGRTDLVRGPDGGPPPPGKYGVAAVEADPSSQPESVRAVIAGTPRSESPSPAWVPADRKLVSLRNYTFLMGKAQGDYDAELRSRHESRGKLWLERTQALGEVHSRLAAALASLRQAVSVAKGGNAGLLGQAARRWEAAQKETTARIDELSRQASDAHSNDQLALIPLLQNGSRALSQAHALAAPGKDPQGLERHLTESAGQLAEFKTRLDQATEAFEKATAPAAPVPTKEGT
jgi:hypothetical protein